MANKKTPPGLSILRAFSRVAFTGSFPGSTEKYLRAYSKTPISVTTSKRSTVSKASKLSQTTVTPPRSRQRVAAISARRLLPSSATTSAPNSPRARVIAPHPQPISNTEPFNKFRKGRRRFMRPRPKWYWVGQSVIALASSSENTLRSSDSRTIPKIRRSTSCPSL